MTTTDQPQSSEAFKNALTRLATDSDYRQRSTSDPSLLVKDFQLTDRDLQALRQVAVMSGADVSEVDRVVGEGAQGLQDVDVTVSCCCCCCCGETGVTTAVA